MKFKDVERIVVQKLRAIASEKGDRMFRIYCDCGSLIGWTKVSRKPREQIGHAILSAIPKQLGIDRYLWTDICGCTKGWLEYQAAVGHAH